MGKIRCDVIEGIIDLNMLWSEQFSIHHGAENIFLGKVRDVNLCRKVTQIEYDCHKKLCIKVFNEIALEAINKFWPEADVVVVHRHGLLKIGEISVAILASTGHRDESYRITRYIIEEIKMRAPIWKKEFYVDGATDWVRGHSLCQHKKVDHHEDSGHPTCGRQIHSHGAR